jgi:hypothetical protein
LYSFSFYSLSCFSEPGKRSRYSDRLRGWTQTGRGSSPVTVKSFLFSTPSWRVLRPTQLTPPRGKAAGTWNWPLHLVPRSRKCGSIHPLPHTSSCRSVWSVKQTDYFNFISGFPETMCWHLHFPQACALHRMTLSAADATVVSCGLLGGDLAAWSLPAWHN